MSYAIFVGKNLTQSGTGYLAGYGDEPSSHWLEVVPETDHPPGATMTVGVSADADMPGRLTEIPQATRTARHLRVCYSYYKGTPAPLTNGGLNEFGVALRDVWSPSRQELIDMTPVTQAGPNYSDLCKLILERARTAREAVELIGSMIAEHGHVTYGGNSHLVADADEAWVVIEFAGGQGLWAAERLGADTIRVSRPGYIGDVPVNRDGGRDWLWSPNFISFAEEQGWYDPAFDGAFHVNKIYGDGRYRWDGVAWVEGELAKLAARPEKIGLHDVMSFVATERLTGDTAGYGQVVPLLDRCHTALRMMWHAHIGASTAPFTPVFLGIQHVPDEFRQHRYLSDREAQRFLDARQLQNLSAISRKVESARSATAIFKRLQYMVFEHHDHFLAEVQSVWRGLERRLSSRASDVSQLAIFALEVGQVALAERCLTYFTEEALLQSLDMAEDLTRSIEIRARISYGMSLNAAGLGPEQIW